MLHLWRPGTLAWALLSTMLDNVLGGHQAIHPKNLRQHYGAAARHLLMPIGKPAGLCREAVDCPQVKDAADTPTLNYPGPTALSETSDRDPFCVAVTLLTIRTQMSVLLGGISAHICTPASICLSPHFPSPQAGAPLAAMLDLVFAQCAEAHWCFFAAVTVDRTFAAHQYKINHHVALGVHCESRAAKAQCRSMI